MSLGDQGTFQAYCSHLMRVPLRYIKNKVRFKKKFSNEILYLKGRKQTNNTNQSILLFTSQRCASVYVKNIIQRLAEEVGMTHINLANYAWKGGKLPRKSSGVFKKYGYFYGPFRDYPDPIYVDNLDDYKIVLMLRDPRDVLTSYYFHHAHESVTKINGNPVQAKFILERSKEALSKSLDEWVLDTTPMYLKIYQTYAEEIFSRPNTLFLKYEDMVQDFDGWLQKLLEFLALDISQNTINEILQKANFKVDREDVKAHKRQVTPGDHKRKLKEETIKFLNLKFNDILATFDYTL